MRLRAYTDGSYCNTRQVYGSGVVIVDEKGNVVEQKSFSGNQAGYIPMRNVSGEIMAAMLAVATAEGLDTSELIICHDYEGVGKWPTGEWKAKNHLTQFYKAFMLAQRKFEIKFEWVRGHSGNYYNNLADRLAKQAVREA